MPAVNRALDGAIFYDDVLPLRIVCKEYQVRSCVAVCRCDELGAVLGAARPPRNWTITRFSIAISDGWWGHVACGVLTWCEYLKRTHGVLVSRLTRCLSSQTVSPVEDLESQFTKVPILSVVIITSPGYWDALAAGIDQ